jgi:hypothetical protein
MCGWLTFLLCCVCSGMMKKLKQKVEELEQQLSVRQHNMQVQVATLTGM